MAEATSHIIEEGKHVVVIARHQHHLKLVRVRKGESIRLGKWKFNLDPVIGSSYGSRFELVRGRLEPRVYRSIEEENAKFHAESGSDNRALVPGAANQKLNADKIDKLRKAGMSGATVVQELVANSKSFKGKHEFSQRKYIQRKKETHVLLVELVRPTVRQLQDVYFQFLPDRIEHIRADGLAALTLHANIQPGSRVLVFETCNGLVAAAALNQLGDSGRLVYLHAGSMMPQLINGCDFPQAVMDRLLPISMSYLADILDARTAFAEADNPTIPDVLSGSKRDRAHAELIFGQFDSLIIATKYNPSNLLRKLFKFLAPSANYSVYHPFREPLVEALNEVKGTSAMLQLYENFLRFHQV